MQVQQLDLRYVFDGPLALVILDGWIGAAVEEGPDRPTRPQFLNALDSQMQCCIPFFVLLVEVGGPGKQVVQRNLRLGIAGPMQWRASAVVDLIQLDAQHLEQVERRRAVALGGYVQHVQSIGIHSAEICT